MACCRSGVSAKFRSVVPFLAEMAHKSPYRTGVLFLANFGTNFYPKPDIMSVEIGSKMCQF